MKLHLPTRLRKAVVASLVAVASLATTLSTATLFTTGAVVSLSSVASAAVEGPGSYTSAGLPTGTTDGATVTLSATQDTAFDISANKSLTLTVDASGQDVKLSGKQNSNDYDYVLASATSDSLWLAQGSFRVYADANLSNAGTIYLGGGQMQFVGDVSLSNNFVIGTSTSTTSPEVLGQTAFRVGHTSQSNTKTQLRGAITVQEDAAISYQNNNHLQLNGTLTGSGSLTLQAWSGSNSSLILNCDTSNYTGAIKNTSNSISLKLAKSAVQLGGLNGSFAVGLDTVTASTLTLNVAEGASYVYNGSIASGISVVKTGEGSQKIQTLLSRTMDVRVDGGSLDFTGSSVDTAQMELAGGELVYPGATENAFIEDNREYKLFEGYEWTGSLVGYEVYASNGDTVIRSTDAIYYVGGEFIVDGSSTNAAKDAVSYMLGDNGTLVISANQSANMTAGKILSEATGAGDIKLTTNASMTGAAQVTGKLAVEGAELTVNMTSNGGNNKTENSFLTSFSAIDLNDAVLRYHGSTTTWNSVTVGEGGATIKIMDMDSGAATPAPNRFLTLAGTTALNGDLTIESSWGGTQKTWKYGVNIAALTGSGDLTIKGTMSSDVPNEYNYVTAKLQDTYEGTITLIHGTGGGTKLTVTADGAINLEGLNITGGNKAQVDLSGVQGTKNLGEVSIGENTTLNLSGTVGDMRTSGAGTLTFNAATNIVGDVYVDSKMTSSAALTIADDASLTCKVNIADDGTVPAYTLNADVTGSISLLVSNAAAIGDAGVAVFDGSFTPTVANVLLESIVSEANGTKYVAAYNNGKLTKTAYTDAATSGALTWKVDGSSNNWGLTTGANWDNAGAAQRWVNDSSVTFDDEKGESISIVSPVTAASATVSQGTEWEWVLGTDKLTITNGVTIAENAALTITGLTLGEAANYEGVVTGAGTLVIKSAGTKSLSALSGVISTATSGGSISTLAIGAGTSLQWDAATRENADAQARMNNITHLEVQNGGRFEHSWGGIVLGGANGSKITIAGAGDSSFEGPAAALVFGYNAPNRTNFHTSRSVELSDDATVWVRSGATSIWTGGVNTNNHTMTVTGGGVLALHGKTSYDLSKIVIENGTTFAYGRLNDDTHVGGVKMEIAEVQAGCMASDVTTISQTLKGGRIEIGKLSGAGTLIIDAKLDTNVGGQIVASTLVSGDSQFDGNISLVNAHNSNANKEFRKAIFGTNSRVALAKANIELTSVVDQRSWLGFVLAGDGTQSIQVAGISTGANMINANAYLISSNKPYSSNGSDVPFGSSTQEATGLTDGIARTLEIVGSGDNTFSGTVLANVNLLMNGSGTQSFAGNLDAFNGSIEVQKGTLNLAKVANTGGITLAGAGATLGVTGGVSGKSLTAKAVGAVLNADLTLSQGSVTFGTDTSAWAATGGLSLANHKLVLDAGNKAALAANLTGLEAGSVVELFTNVSALNDAAGNALSLADTARVSDYFSAADSTLGGYLLNWSDGKLSLVMKDELKDLVWDDASTENTWQSTAGLTNWTNTATDASTFFSIADSVTFAGQGETVSIVGTVKPMDVDVEAGTYEWDGSGNVEASGTLTVGSDNSAANLTIGNSGNKSFAGGIELKNGSVLTVTDNTGWSGTATGDGVLKLQTGKDVGDLAQYVAVPTEEAPDKLGTLEVSGSGTALTLSSAALAAPTAGINDLRVSDAGVLNLTENVTVDTGVMVSAYDGAINVASGKAATIADLLYTYGTMTKNGDGTLVLAGHADTYGNTENANANDDANGQTIIAAGTLKIDDNAPTDVPNYIADISTYDLGDVSGAGTLLLSNGSVVANSVADTLTVNVATEAAGDVVELSGVQGSSLDSISLAAGTQLKGAMGDITVGGTDNVQSMTLVLDGDNVGTSSTIAADKKAMIDQTDAAKLIINEGASARVELGIDAVVKALEAASTNEENVYLHLTTGTLECVGDVELDYTEANVSVELMKRFGVKESGIEGGSIKLAGGADGIYISSVHGNVVTSDKLLSTKQATVVSQDDTLTLQLDGATMADPARINNLLGATGSTLALENTSADMIARVELRNKLQQIDNPEPAEATGADTYMAGDIDGTAGAGEVEVIISGPGTLTVGGNLTTALLTMQEGGLTLDGEANEVDYLGDGVLDPAAEQPVLTVNGKLTVAGESAVFSTKIAGDGTLVLEDNLNVADSAKLAGVGIELQKTNFGTEGSLSLDGVQDAEVSALSGNGILQGKDATLTVTGQGGSFSGTLTAIDTTAPGTNVLAVAQGGSQTLDRVNGSRDWSMENAGELIINITNPAVTTGTGTNKTLTLDSLTAKSGSLTTLVINSDAPGTYLDLNTLVLEDGATVAVNSTGLDEVDFGGSITLARTANGVTLGDDVAVNLADCIAFKKVREAWLETDGKVLTLQTEYHDENQYAKMAASENAMAGATMLWSVNTGALPNASPLKSVDEAVNALSKLGTAEAAAEGDKIMAAVAGSSTAILGSALASDVERQLRAIRNRTTTMGVSQAAVNEYMPYYNAWINAEGDHHEVDADGMAPGYTRDSWGGTVGFDVDVTPSFTMGLAVTAMYGDVESQGPDKLDGDFDTQYLSLFARYTHNAWTHTFVATVGRADISMERTVNYGTGRYTAEGETEGMALGFMYEVGRVYSLTESGDVCLQPVFNVSLRRSTVDGYEETACDAGVAVDDQTATTLTFGAGARMQAVIGTSLYNRATILEARALVKFDAGDREGEADVRLLQGGAGSTVKSAELGAFGAEIGMGVTIPMGSDAGSVFVDGSLEVRSGYTNINGTVGYRVNF